MKLKPLAEYICDTCGELIDLGAYSGAGYLEWSEEKGDQPGPALEGFRIVHNLERCLYARAERAGDVPLESLLGSDGLVYLLAFLERDRIADLGQFLDVVRRLHVPHYEEARQYWGAAEDDSFFTSRNPSSVYMQDTLAAVIEEYGDDQDDEDE